MIDHLGQGRRPAALRPATGFLVRSPSPTLSSGERSPIVPCGIVLIPRGELAPAADFDTAVIAAKQVRALATMCGRSRGRRYPRGRRASHCDGRRSLREHPQWELFIFLGDWRRAVLGDAVAADDAIAVSCNNRACGCGHEPGRAFVPSRGARL